MYTNGIAYIFSVGDNGALGSGYAYTPLAIASVINLSADYASTLIGTGTMTDPYRSQ